MGGPCSATSVNRAPKLRGDLHGERLHGRFPDDGEHFRGIDRSDSYFAALLIDNHIEGQQQTKVDLLLQCVVGKRRIACAQDHVAGEVDAQLLFELGLNVNLAEYAESFFL